jgi:hypothetical protein
MAISTLYRKNFVTNVGESFRNKEHIDFPDVIIMVQKFVIQDIIGKLYINFEKQISSPIKQPDV